MQTNNNYVKILGTKIENDKMGHLMFFSDLYTPHGIHSYTPHTHKTHKTYQIENKTKHRNKQNLTHTQTHIHTHSDGCGRVCL